MSIGTVFFLAATVLFFLAAVGSALIPNPASWGLVCLALGLLTGGFAFRAGTIVRV